MYLIGKKIGLNIVGLIFVGRNFSQRPKIKSLLADFFFTDKVIVFGMRHVAILIYWLIGDIGALGTV